MTVPGSAYLFAMLAVLSISQSAASGAENTADPTLASMTYQFKTTTNDKDWDTAVAVHVICNNHDVAYRECCGADRRADHWDNDSHSQILDLPLTEMPTKNVLDACTFRVTARARGNDEWHFEAYLFSKYNDGSKRDWRFLGGGLNSRSSNIAIQDFPMSKNHD